MEVPGLRGDSEDSSLHDATALHTVQGNVGTKCMLKRNKILSPQGRDHFPL